ncbi:MULTISPECIES: 16S rRNA (uracil(1498)-N(3))-methyltransferase [unclassified Ruminococcus]|uniref:16S rRNA (uracil(1498)-N(3))-methyltransferase n=1 Tax=unclassified Ruminococcus TaxID=2608920 RepID=UPI0021099998|nr:MULTISPECIES: 16S rRNA (uracil(1498)-N(3))-methyltransferase [unclassified Ruminococcus]MCQ4021596.1 16S rRNA (uracil(1498)-N(3))-methyltransferase [Ruminococcus sp. zg-924]MCQ4114041.1 16S rRNA (uracil(1498)-N(3))-methyltransferase [Ruminococcus sp. zg-921]
MAWFFSEIEPENFFTFEGEQARHISGSLRMKIGEELTICCGEYTYPCTIESIDKTSVTVKVNGKHPCVNEPSTEVTLFQAIPKGDKMDYIVQKAVELGVTRIVPFISSRCISRPDEKSIAKKTVRWQKIALQAAQQSRRGIISTVESAVSLETAAEKAASLQRSIVFYECGGESPSSVISPDLNEIGIFIGSEGGFAPEEIELLKSKGMGVATLGNRILRAETAPIAALSVIMYITGNLG